MGDEAMQLDFAVQELKSEYIGLWSFLCSTEDIYTATERICEEFERPAVNNTDTRYAFALKWDKEFGGKAEKTWFPPDLSILVLQSVLVGNGYNTEISGYKSGQFFDTLAEFVRDIGGGEHA